MNARTSGTRGSSIQSKIEETRLALVNRLLSDMEKDGLNWQKGWVGAMPVNAVTGDTYRGRNALALRFQMIENGFDDPRFMTFNQAKEAGWSVKKGAHAQVVERWKRFVVPAKDSKKRVPQPKTALEWAAAYDNPELKIIFRQVGGWYVFNASQVNGIEPYVMNNELTGIETVEMLEADSPVPVFERPQDHAYFSPKTDSIVLPCREQFSDMGEMARTLLHEQAHSTMTPNRCNRTSGGRFGDEVYAFEELVAEISSMFSACELRVDVCAPAKAETEYMRQHAAYVKGWVSRAGDAEVVDLVMAAASKAGEATTWLMEHCFQDRVAELAHEGRANVPLAEQGEEARAAAEEAPRDAPKPSKGRGVR